MLVTCLITENKYKQLSVTNQRNHKDKENTLVQIGNTTSTYNRSSSASLKTLPANTDLLTPNSTAAPVDIEEQESQTLLLGM